MTAKVLAVIHPDGRVTVHHTGRVQVKLVSYGAGGDVPMVRSLSKKWRDVLFNSKDILEEWPDTRTMDDRIELAARWLACELLAGVVEDLEARHLLAKDTPP